MRQTAARTFIAWTTLSSLGVVAACSESANWDAVKATAADAGAVVVDDQSSNGSTSPSIGQSTSNVAPNSSAASASTVTTTASSGSNAAATTSDGVPPRTDTSVGGEPQPDIVALPLAADAFPIGLQVESLLSRQVPVDPGLALLQWLGPNGETSAKAQIARALSAVTAADCAVALPTAQGPATPSCYGPALDYENHPDGQCQPPPGDNNANVCVFPSGDLGIWNAMEADTSEACTAAKLNADINHVGLRVDTALVIAASTACSLATAGRAMPTAGNTEDATELLQAALAVNQPDIKIRAASVENEAATDTNEPAYLYAIEGELSGQRVRYFLRHTPGNGEQQYSGRLWGEMGTGASALLPQGPPNSAELPPPNNPPVQLWAVSVVDGGALDDAATPNNEPDAAFADVLDGGAPVPPPKDGSMPPPDCQGSNCPPPPDCQAGNCPPPPDCQGSNCPPPPDCQGSNCPPPPDGMMGPVEGGEFEVFSVDYELTNQDRLRTKMLSRSGTVGGEQAFTIEGELAPDAGWRMSMALTVIDVDLATGTGKAAYLWQAGPHDDRTRVFNVFTEGGNGGQLNGCGFFGYGQPFGSQLPPLAIENFICNWAGPNNSHQGLPNRAQKQCMAPNSFGIWQPTDSQIAYAPQNSCESSSAAFLGGTHQTDASSWTPFAEQSQLVDLSVDPDYTSGFGIGPTGPAL